MPKIKVAVYCPNPGDGTSLYRGIGPLGSLRKISTEFEFFYNQAFDWSVAKMCDVVFMQRPFTADDWMIADICNINKIPLWIDYDDDLLQVPMSNKAHKTYKNDSVKKNIIKLIAVADCVTVSTEALKKSFDVFREASEKGSGKRKSRCVVIPNAHDDYLFTEPMGPTNKIIMWRGSATHDKDLWKYTAAMSVVAKEFPEWSWVFVGSPFWLTIESMGRDVQMVESMDPIQYFKFIEKLRPAVQIVPLHDSEFNKAKSNIAWIEGSYAGATTLVPDWEEWQKPGAVLYTSDAKDPMKSEESFALKLREILKQEKDLPTFNQKSWEYISENLFLSKVNKTRAEIIYRIAEGSFNR